jgi:hypothetical protein
MRRGAALEKICAPQRGDEQMDRSIAAILKRIAKVEASVLAGLGGGSRGAQVIVCFVVAGPTRSNLKAKSGRDKLLGNRFKPYRTHRSAGRKSSNTSSGP